MTDKLVISIVETKNKKQIDICAEMMSTTDPWLRYGMGQTLCLKAFEGDFREIYIAQINHSVVGFAILQMKGTFKGYIQTLCIGEKWRGKGLGRKLLEFCEKKILEVSPNIFICVSEFNKGAIRLYEEFGFQLVGKLDDFLKPGLSELLMRKTRGSILGYETSRQAK